MHRYNIITAHVIVCLSSFSRFLIPELLLLHQMTTVASKRQPMATVARGIIQSEGVRGLWTGFAPRLARVAPASAVMLSCYEFFRSNRIFVADQ